MSMSIEKIISIKNNIGFPNEPGVTSYLTPTAVRKTYSCLNLYMRILHHFHKFFKKFILVF